MAPLTHRFLYATDLSAKSVEALHYAINFAIEHDAKLMVLHVISKRTIIVSKIIGRFFNKAHEPTIKKAKGVSPMQRLKSQLEIICEKEFKEHTECINNIEKLVVLCGDISEEIVEKADRWGCESILIGHRKGFLSQSTPGRISRNVFRFAPKSVHLIPST